MDAVSPKHSLVQPTTCWLLALVLGVEGEDDAVGLNCGVSVLGASVIEKDLVIAS